ncbi:MAG TPA: enolase C-terminal domain-like protein [Burkholderiales bacterium]|nr:enolase C-terminal domain-like protein [Burkholderiales bacterium]
MDRLDSIAAYRLQVPLTKPYRLAFGAVERYDTIVVTATHDSGRTGLGEATVLTGYTDETIDDAWSVAKRFASSLLDMPAAAGRAALRELAGTHPFTATAFGTALEMLDAPERFRAPALSVPLVGLVDAKGHEAIARQLDALLETGYRTVKIKVGFDVGADLEFVRAVQRAGRSRVRIRIDANQGYTAEQGVAFVRGLEPDSIELFEQPCAAGDWDAHRAVARASGVPLMLDESIYGLPDIEKAASLECAQFIKVKLMKFVTLDALAGAIERIQALGMQAVLGNGVACDIGCLLEALVAAGRIDNAGEMNGFLKTTGTLLDRPLAFEDGALELEPGYTPRIDLDSVQRYCVDSICCGAAAAAPSAAA